MKCSSPPEWKRFRPLGMGIHSKPTLCAERKRKKARSPQRMGHPRCGEGQKRRAESLGHPASWCYCGKNANRPTLGGLSGPVTNRISFLLVLPLSEAGHVGITNRTF